PIMKAGGASPMLNRPDLEVPSNDKQLSRDGILDKPNFPEPRTPGFAATRLQSGRGRTPEETNMRQGLLFYGNLSLADTVAVGGAAEEGGFDSLHYVEAYRSPFVALAALANATSRVRLGSYIANAYAHSPFGMALAALDLDELSGGRFVLGVGSGNQHLNK